MSQLRIVGNIFDLQPLEVRRFLAVTNAFVDSNHVLQVLGSSGSDTITVNKIGSGAGRLTVSDWPTTFNVGSGSGEANAIQVQGDAGADTILITNNVRFSVTGNTAGIPATLAGNAGNDTMTGGPGNDVLSGGDNDDRMDGGAGNDLMTGGSGFDTSNYSTRGGAIRVTMGSGANDGEVSLSEADDVQTEECIGGSGNDTITGSSLADYIGGGGGEDQLSGGDGNDRLTGNEGSDNLQGQNNDDSIYAMNQDADVVAGGPGNDLASIDTIDTGGALTAGDAIAAAPGDGSALDPSYDADGIARGPAPGWQLRKTAVDSQGRAYFAGTRFGPWNGNGYNDDFAVARYTSTGQLDTQFGFEGFAYVDFTSEPGLVGSGYGASPNTQDDLNGMTIAPDGKIILVGATHADGAFGTDTAVARLNPNGTLDNTFDGNGLKVISVQGSGYNDDGTDAVVQSDGNIVVVGTASEFFNNGRDFAVSRLTDLGALDNSFAGDGTTTFDVNDGSFDLNPSVALQQPVTILTTKATTGKITQAAVSAQRIIVGGTSDDLFTLVRFNPDGTRDTNFGVGGVAQQDVVPSGLEFLEEIDVDSNNRIAAVGSSNNFIAGITDGTSNVEPNTQDAVLAVYSADGTTVTVKDVAPTDGFYASFNSVDVDSQNRILVGGVDNSEFVVARFNPDLTYDESFAPGLVHTDASQSESYNEAYGIFALSDGKVLAAGVANVSESTQLAAVRYVGTTDVPPDGEGEVTGIETFKSYDDVQNDPMPDASPDARLYTKSQPDNDGVARIRLDDNDRDDVVIISKVKAGNGHTDTAVNINGLVIYYDVATTKRIEIYTKGGSDKVIGTDAVKTPLLVDGGTGNDWLTAAGGDDIVLGGTGNDFMNGLSGNDIMLGGEGNDDMLGWFGNDILIGGKGRDVLFGFLGDNILIGGTTSHDNNTGALQSILAEWTSSHPRSVRINNIRNGGGLNGTNKFRVGTGATVFDDAASDYLTGGSSGDWFFYKKTGTTRDFLVFTLPGTTFDTL